MFRANLICLAQVTKSAVLHLWLVGLICGRICRVVLGLADVGDVEDKGGSRDRSTTSRSMGERGKGEKGKDQSERCLEQS